MPSNHLILCRPLLLLPSVFPSIRVFASEPVLRIRWPKYWSLSFSISPSNEYSGLISFRIDQQDLLAVQGTLKSFLTAPQFKSIYSLVLSFLYSPTLTSIHDYWKKPQLSLDGPLLAKQCLYSFKMLSRLVITFLLGSKHVLISWLAVTICSDFVAPKDKVYHCFHCFSIYLP